MFLRKKLSIVCSVNTRRLYSLLVLLPAIGLLDGLFPEETAVEFELDETLEGTLSGD